MSVNPEEIDRIWKEADCLLSKDQVERAIDELAGKVEARLEKSNPIILSVMKGGLVFTSKLMMRLSFPVELDYIHVTRYGFGLTGNELQWKVTPQDGLEGRTVLIVDDILDEGQTLAAIVAACEAQGAGEVLSAVLVDKKHDRKADPTFKADFTGMEVEDRFIFGYGMDYKGYLRNAAGIYAVKEN
ncbi:hypoxanthine-guanine phosphoribosyltransferase [Gammaproteobacteria bacterium 45_16_T64]|nr:hypoxanthine-guanine phosphoribosyltransferase [Gammaproteobacteria bacterium 45_16_T64]